MSRVKILKAELADGSDVNFGKLKELKDFLDNHIDFKYGDDEILKMIRYKDKELREHEDKGMEAAKKKYPGLFEGNMFYWRLVKESIMLDDRHQELSFALETDFVDSGLFRNTVNMYGQTVYGSCKVKIHLGKLLIFVFGSFVGTGHLENAIQEILHQTGMSFQRISWDPASLRRIESKESFKTTRTKVTKIDNELTVDMRNEFGVTHTATGSSLHDSGSMRAIRYDSKVKQSNWIQIAGDYGIVSTSLNEADTIDYIITQLIGESNF